ncbi:hypothetical protein CPB84DRAFT_1851768 [Gymnopilus junonius]|uniref:Uncharacterized protein n=1 Tax=Gymnopilus junonius TaxID=109634 RepID=A0A9P5NEG5_GYMJU|nr:hypothetical protein CPB84DRAFT_1851768 [Gymnopilus junonius]
MDYLKTTIYVYLDPLPPSQIPERSPQDKSFGLATREAVKILNTFLAYDSQAILQAFEGSVAGSQSCAMITHCSLHSRLGSWGGAAVDHVNMDATLERHMRGYGCQSSSLQSFKLLPPQDQSAVVVTMMCSGFWRSIQDFSIHTAVPINQTNETERPPLHHLGHTSCELPHSDPTSSTRVFDQTYLNLYTKWQTPPLGDAATSTAGTKGDADSTGEQTGAAIATLHADALGTHCDSENDGVLRLRLLPAWILPRVEVYRPTRDASGCSRDGDGDGCEGRFRGDVDVDEDEDGEALRAKAIEGAKLTMMTRRKANSGPKGLIARAKVDRVDKKGYQEGPDEPSLFLLFCVRVYGCICVCYVSCDFTLARFISRKQAADFSMQRRGHYGGGSGGGSMEEEEEEEKESSYE